MRAQGRSQSPACLYLAARGLCGGETVCSWGMPAESTLGFQGGHEALSPASIKRGRHLHPRLDARNHSVLQLR